MPSSTAIETSLRAAVRTHFASASTDPPSVNSIRAISTAELNLDEDFYKSAEWKQRSKQIIQDQFEKCEAEKAGQTAKHVKRASPDIEDVEERPRKRSRVSKVREQDEDGDESTALSEPPESDEEEEKKPKKKEQKKGKVEKGKVEKKEKTAPKKVAKSKSKKNRTPSELSDAPPEDTTALDEGVNNAEAIEAANETSSSLSSVMDDPDPPRKKSKAKNGDGKAPSKSKKSTTTKTQSKPATDSDPNTEEIKRLQSWLVKCGIRKVWGKELKPYDTPKAKISHLKSMLSDVGMTGRYSNEKAASIKERRELAADIEAVKEGNERWGKNEEDDGSGQEETKRPARKLIRGMQNYDFLSSDAEETD